MKKIICFLLFFLISGKVFAISPTASVSATPKEENLSKIQELKEKVAQKVTELRKNKKIVYYGEIKEVSDESFTLLTNDGEKTIETIKKTNFLWLNSQNKILNISFSNLEKGDFVSVDGELENGDKITAKTVIGKIQNFLLTAKINKILKSGQEILVSVNTKDVPMSILITAKTKILLFDKITGISFGKTNDLVEDQKIIIVGNYKEVEKENIEAKKIIVISNLKTTEKQKENIKLSN